MKKFIYIVLVVSLLANVALLFNDFLNSPMQVSATEYLEDYAKDESMAKDKYSGEITQITGTYAGMGTYDGVGEYDTKYICIQSVDISGVICTELIEGGLNEAKVSNLNIGDDMVLQGYDEGWARHGLKEYDGSIYLLEPNAIIV